MSTWMTQVRHYIKKGIKKRVAGSGHMYIVSMFLILFLMLLFKMSSDKERVYVTYDMVEDSLVTALVSSCVCNTTEYGVSDQLVIYRDLTPKKIPPVFVDILNGLGAVLPQQEYDPLSDPEIYSPNGDYYLDNCYEKFYENLKHNLKLDNEMNATISGISGKVSITDFSVFNVYRDFDEAGNQTGFRIVKYTREANGNWSVYDYGIDTLATVYSTFEHTDIEITETSVSAALTFDLVLSNYSAWLMENLTENDMKESVTYQRVVDITN